MVSLKRNFSKFYFAKLKLPHINISGCVGEINTINEEHRILFSLHYTTFVFSISFIFIVIVQLIIR